MKTTLIVSLAALLAGGGLAAATAPAAKATRPDGPALYQKHCAVCHGADAHGDGPWADVLAYRPVDLTRIAIHSGGDFPAAKVRAAIDGRKPAKGRLPSVMPVWGEALKTPENRYSEAAVREQISALVDYLRTIQVAAEDRQAGDVVPAWRAP
jgi:mono/diheme cytochrome c family protein